MNELEEGRGKYVEIDGFRLAVFLNEGQISVMDDLCPHAGGSLAGGPVIDGCAVCPRHQWRFRLDNGELRDSPGVGVRIYRTRLLNRESGTMVQAELPTY